MTILFTTEFDLPYPQGTDTPDVPRDVHALAEATEDALQHVNSFAAPIGSIMIWPTPVAPSGWFLCQGATIDCKGVDYPALATLLGTDGSDNVLIPNLKGRMVLGSGESTATAHSAHALLSTGGEEKHTLLPAELATHTHPAGIGNPVGAQYMVHGDTGESSYFHSFGSPGAGDFLFSFQSPHNNAGGGQSHNTLPPFLSLNFIIRASL